MRPRAFEFAEMLTHEVGDFDEASRVLQRRRNRTRIIRISSPARRVSPQSRPAGRRPELRALRSCGWTLTWRTRCCCGAVPGRGTTRKGGSLPGASRAAAAHDFQARELLAAPTGCPAIGPAAEHDRRRQELVASRTRLTVLNKKAADHPLDADTRFEIAAIYNAMELRSEARHSLRAALAWIRATWPRRNSLGRWMA